MTPEDIQAMAKGLAEGQALWYLLSAIIGGAITGFGAYLAEKGKNRATKEDIAVITHEVEKVRDEFGRGLEDLKAHHQLRMVAAERRLQAHQEAYTHWQNLVSAILQLEKHQTFQLASEAKTWYVKNCIYLTQTSRQAFVKTWECVYAYYIHTPSRTAEEFIQITHDLNAQGNVFLREVDLPELRAIDLLQNR
ncbi:hypothetical protein ACLS0R_14910 [Comamonas jiangduensis]|uniref:hypothetical protein n=1 Tax=Comamonas jiangduensis TaxID=1194168 RepID=UPI003BF867D1